MSKSVPVVGQAFLGDEPEPLKAIKVTLGFATTEDVQLASGSTTQTKALLSVAAGVRVFDIQWQVKTAFGAASTINVGDGNSSDGFLTSAMIGPTTSAAQPSRMVGDTSASRAGGFVYSAADTIDAAYVAPAAASDGEVGVIEFVFFYTASLDN